MDFQPTPEQTSLVDAVEHILDPYREAPRRGEFHVYDRNLDAKLRESGFLDVAREEGLGPLEAALIVECICKSPVAIEAAASALVAPQVVDEPILGPVALVADPRRAARFLDVANSAFVLSDGAAYLVDLRGSPRAPVHTLLAYPYAHFETPPDLAGARRLSDAQADRLACWWRLSIAVEAAGAMQAALKFTVEYVTARRQFNRPLGSYQAIQHRLAERTVNAQATHWLAIEAAWKEDPAAAALAAAYAQQMIPAFIHDLHQFNGALGVTLDHPLHYWTYRLAALLSELGGPSAQALAATRQLWLARAA